MVVYDDISRNENHDIENICNNDNYKDPRQWCERSSEEYTDKPELRFCIRKPTFAEGSEVAEFVKRLSSECDKPRIYLYSFTHPISLTYTVILSGLLFELGFSKLFSCLVPPSVIFFIVHYRYKVFIKSSSGNSFCKTLNLVPTSSQNVMQYYNRRRRALFVAVAQITKNTFNYDADSCYNIGIKSYTDSSLPANNECTVTGDIMSESLVGTIAIDGDSDGTATIKHLCVEGLYRRNGIGQELLNRALQFCAQEMYSRVELCTTSLQSPAFSLYKKNSFKKLKDTMLMSLIPGVQVMQYHFIKCLRNRHTSSCCRIGWN